MKLGQIIYNYRVEHKLSQDYLADKIGVNKSLISRLERDKISDNVHIETLCKFAKAMETDIFDLLEQMNKTRANLIPNGNEINLFANAVRMRREELGISQTKLANLMGYKHKTAITRIENGQQNVVQSEVAKLARALQTTPNYLMGWTPKSESNKPLTSEEVDLVNKYRELNESNKQMISNILENSLHAQQVTGQNVQGNSNIVAGGNQYINRD